ncbi:MAG: hypothetical protein ACSHYF_11885 [Verrucomicrobiaceae bacterium]
MFPSLFHRFPCVLLFVVSLFVGRLEAVSTITEEDFKGDDTIVLTETIEFKSRLYASVITEEEWASEIPKGKVVLVDYALADKAWRYSSRLSGDHVEELFRRAKRPSKKEFAEAKKKDQEALRKLEEEVKLMEKKLGLIPQSDDEGVAYFYAGEAKMKVIETFKGDLQKGDTIKVTWKNVLRKRSCPHMTPYKGKAVWLLKGAVKAGGEAELLRGDPRGLEEIRKAAEKAKEEAARPE